MNILITGASGFLGRHIIASLVKEERNSIFATSLAFDGLECFNGKITFIPNNEILQFDFSKIDVVINCAFPRLADGKEFAEGIVFLNELIKKIQVYDSCGFIDISSQSVYSFSRKEPADENTQLDLAEKYEVGKYCIELLLDARLEKHKRIHLRLASLIGPFFEQRIVNRFIRNVISGNDIVINGGKQLFGFMDVRDCADAICRVINYWDSVDLFGQVFNLGPVASNSLLKIGETVLAIGKAMGFNKSKLIINESDEWINTSVNSSQFYHFFDWNPKHSLSDSISSIFTSYLSEH